MTLLREPLRLISMDEHGPLDEPFALQTLQTGCAMISGSETTLSSPKIEGVDTVDSCITYLPTSAHIELRLARFPVPLFIHCHIMSYIYIRATPPCRRPRGGGWDGSRGGRCGEGEAG